MYKKQLQIIAVAVALAVIVAAGSLAITGFLAFPKDTTEKVLIGAVLPLTGVSAIYGQFPKEGMELALNEINSAGGVNGKQLEIIYEDSTSSQTTAVTSLRKLIDTAGVAVVIVGASSPETLAMAPLAEESGTVLLACGSAAPKIRDAGDYIFRLKVSVDQETAELARFAYEDLGARKMSILYLNNDYGVGGKEFFEKQFPLQGGEVLNMEAFDIEDTDFRTQLLKINERSPDAVYLIGWPRNMGEILKTAKELGIEGPFIAPGGTIGPEIIEIAGNAADGLIYIMEYDSESERQQTLEFISKFSVRYEKDPELFAAMGYDAVKIIASLLEHCGEDADCIKQGLYDTQNYEGVSAIISFDDHGDVEKPMRFMTISGGEFVRYEG